MSLTGERCPDKVRGFGFPQILASYTEVANDMPAEQFQHFRIETKLGSGGMGEVYLALDQKLDRLVALKILPKQLGADPVRRARFLQEAKTASSLTHPNVCVIYEIGESSDHQPYIAMERVEGEPLDQIIAGRPLPISTVIGFALQVSDALIAASEVGIVHRDIKPSNIMVNGRNQAKVLDFGLAKRLQEQPLGETTDLAKTREGQIMGTPNYMSPEQALGRSVDHRSDIFSFGVVMYEMATGQLPFLGDTLGEIINQIVHAVPRAPTRHNPEVSVELERIALRCLRKSPEERYQDAGELHEALRELQNGLLPGNREQDLGVTQSSVASALGTGSSSNLSAELIKNTDVLISCAELDDQPMSLGGEGWVDRLKRNLKIKIEQLTGDSLKVETASLPPGKLEVEDTVYESMATARTLVSVISPPFIKSKSCNQSVDEYCRTTTRTGESPRDLSHKLFKVFKSPVTSNEIPQGISDALSQVSGFEFYDTCSDTGRVREFDDSYGDDVSQRYYERVYDLAYEVCQGLRHQAADVDTVKTNTGSRSVHAIKTVFLAETTSDLNDARDRLKRELLEQGHRVLPDRALPQIAGELDKALASYLEQCNFAIHLIGNRYGIVPEDASDSSVVLQNLAASQCSTQRKLPRIIWMPRDVAPTDTRQTAFIESLVQDPTAQAGADVIRDTMENLKQLLDERWQKEAEQIANLPSNSDSQIMDDVARLYLIHDIEDEQEVEKLEDYFYELGIEVILPEFEGSESQVSAVHIQNLTDCDAVLVYYGTTAKSWVDIKLRELTKAVGYRDGRPIDLRAVYIAPPEDRRKERFKTLSAELIRQTGPDITGSDLEKLAIRIKELKTKSKSG